MHSIWNPKQLLGLVIALWALVTTTPGQAQTAQSEASGEVRSACISAHETGQELRISSKLLESKNSLHRCAQEDCPSVIRVDCLRWLDEVEAAIPTIVVVAESDRGDETNVRIGIDGQTVANQLDGKPIDLNPGSHYLIFEFTGARPMEMQLFLGQGDKNRIIRLDFRSKPTVGPLTTPAAHATDIPPPLTSRPVPNMTYVFGGTALVAAASATYFGLKASAARNSAAISCAPLCSDSVVSDIKRKALYSDLSTSVALISAGTAAALYFTRPAVFSSSSSPSSVALELLQLGVTPLGGYVGMGGTFQ
jgi:hypothetical protein